MKSTIICGDGTNKNTPHKAPWNRRLPPEERRRMLHKRYRKNQSQFKYNQRRVDDNPENRNQLHLALNGDLEHRKTNQTHSPYS